MEIELILEKLNGSGIHTFYPLAFPTSAPDGCSYIETSGGTPERGGVNRMFLRVMTRETHPSLSLQKSYAIRKYLSENLKGAFFNSDEKQREVLNVEPDTPTPLYVGEEDGKFITSYNYTLILG